MSESHERFREQLRAQIEAALTDLGLHWERYVEQFAWHVSRSDRDDYASYDMQVLADLRGLVIFYGNSDGGPSICLLRQGVLIPLRPEPPTLDHPPIAVVLREFFDDHYTWPPNMYGLT